MVAFINILSFDSSVKGMLHIISLSIISQESLLAIAGCHIQENHISLLIKTGLLVSEEGTRMCSNLLSIRVSTHILKIVYNSLLSAFTERKKLCGIGAPVGFRFPWEIMKKLPPVNFSSSLFYQKSNWTSYISSMEKWYKYPFYLDVGTTISWSEILLVCYSKYWLSIKKPDAGKL